MVERFYNLKDLEFLLSYIDPHDNDLLPINNDDNFTRALSTAKPLLRLIVQRKGMLSWIIDSCLCDEWIHCLIVMDFLVVVGDSLEEITGYGTLRPRNIISSILGQTPAKSKSLAISNPHDFRQVSAIIDVDVVPETCRRVKLLKHGSDKPLGFYIRYGNQFQFSIYHYQMIENNPL